MPNEPKEGAARTNYSDNNFKLCSTAPASSDLSVRTESITNESYPRVPSVPQHQLQGELFSRFLANYALSSAKAPLSAWFLSGEGGVDANDDLTRFDTTILSYNARPPKLSISRYVRPGGRRKPFIASRCWARRSRALQRGARRCTRVAEGNDNTHAPRPPTIARKGLLQ